MSTGWTNFFWSGGALQMMPTDDQSTSASTARSTKIKTFADITLFTYQIVKPSKNSEYCIKIPVGIIEFKKTEALSDSDFEAALSQIITNCRDRMFQDDGDLKGNARIPSEHYQGKFAKHTPLIALSVCGNKCRRIFLVDKDTAYVDTASVNLERRSLDGVLPSCTEKDWKIWLSLGTAQVDHFLAMANAYCDFIADIDTSGPFWRQIYHVDELDPYLSSLGDTREPFQQVDLYKPATRSIIANRHKAGKRKREDQAPPSTQRPPKDGGGDAPGGHDQPGGSSQDPSGPANPSKKGKGGSGPTGKRHDRGGAGTTANTTQAATQVDSAVESRAPEDSRSAVGTGTY
jgi:hypothetical protein